MTTPLRPLAALLCISFLASVTWAEQASAPRRVALVFDDGPIPGKTESFLELFAKEHVHVTFSHIGQKVADQPALARSVVDAGHEVINHSNTHPHFTDLDDQAIQAEVRIAQDRITGAIGRPARWFWLPYGGWDKRIESAVRAAGLEHYPVMRFPFVSTDDWDPKTDAATIGKRATTDIRDKTVILFHEFPDNTLTQLPDIIATLKKQGVQFMTFSELLEADRLESEAAVAPAK